MAYYPAIIAKKERVKYRKWKLAQPDGNELMNILKHMTPTSYEIVFLSSHPLLTKKYVFEHPNFAWDLRAMKVLSGEDMEEFLRINGYCIDDFLDRNISGLVEIGEGFISMSVCIENFYRLKQRNMLSNNTLIELLSTKSMSERQILKYYDKINWPLLSKVVDIKIITKYPNWPWSWYHMSENPNINDEFLAEELPKHKSWDWFGLSINNSISTEFVLSHLNFTWVLCDAKHDFNIDFIKIMLFGNLNFEYLMGVSKEHFDYLIHNIPFLINRPLSSLHAPIEYIIQNPEIRWDWDKVGINKNMTAEFFKQLNEEYGVYVDISNNPVFNIEDVIKLSPCNLDGISLNPNLKYSDIINHPEINWNISHICENIFIYDDYVCDITMKKDKEKKRLFILEGATGWVPDLAEIVALYCGYM
mgnify:CR=1 FL=1